MASWPCRLALHATCPLVPCYKYPKTMQLLGIINYCILKLFYEVINSLAFMLLFTPCWNHHILHVIKQPAQPLGQIYCISLSHHVLSCYISLKKQSPECDFTLRLLITSCSSFYYYSHTYILTVKATSGHLQKGRLRLTKLAEVACNRGEAGSLLGGCFMKVVSSTRPIVLPFHSEPTFVNRK